MKPNIAVKAAPSGRWTLRDKAPRRAAPLTYNVRGHVVYLVLTRNGYEELIGQFQCAPSPLWVNKDVLSKTELSSLRSSGIALTDFIYPISPSDTQEVSEAAYTVKEHHPNESVWVEYVPAL